MIKINNECNNENSRILRNKNNLKQTIQLKNHYGEHFLTFLSIL
jgi:hypothetical protein